MPGTVDAGDWFSQPKSAVAVPPAPDDIESFKGKTDWIKAAVTLPAGWISGVTREQIADRGRTADIRFHRRDLLGWGRGTLTDEAAHHPRPALHR